MNMTIQQIPGQLRDPNLYESLVCSWFKIWLMITKPSPLQEKLLICRAPCKLLFVELPVKFPLCFLTVVMLHSTFKELWQAETCLFKWILWKCNTSFLTPVCISIQTQQKGSFILMLNVQNNISNFLFLTEVGEANYLHLLFHLFLQLTVHSSIMYWIIALYQALWVVTGYII